MTYCTERTNLLAQVGPELAEQLLPKPFWLRYSNHSTGLQMMIGAGPDLCVWQGSIWYHSRYEFNDTGDVPGLQPDFEFAKPVIDKYFEDVLAALDKARIARWACDSARTLKASADRLAAIESVRAQLQAEVCAGTHDEMGRPA